MNTYYLSTIMQTMQTKPATNDSGASESRNSKFLLYRKQHPI